MKIIRYQIPEIEEQNKLICSEKGTVLNSKAVVIYFYTTNFLAEKTKPPSEIGTMFKMILSCIKCLSTNHV
jgi:hypothetical protein